MFFAPIRAENTLVQSPTAEPLSLSLSDCYKFALEQAEKLKEQMQKMDQIDWRYQSAFGGILPRFSFNATEFLQDSGGRGDSGSGSNLTRTERPEMKFVLRQPIFSGFREFAAMSALKHDRAKEQFTHARIAREIFLEVSRVFYSAISSYRPVQSQYPDLTCDRVRELKERERLGNPVSEVSPSNPNLRNQPSALAQQDQSFAINLLSFPYRP